MSSLLDAFCDDSPAAQASLSVMVVAAHPDDESLGAAGRMAVLRNPWIVHVTDGAPKDMQDAAEAGLATREEYAKARREELAAALRLVGIGMDRTRWLGVVDQEASLNMAGLAHRIADLFQELAPDLVLTHPYEGGHPDHDATAFAVHAARELLVPRGQPAPELIEFTSYHDQNGGMSFFEFLPCEGCEVRTMVLSPQVRELKRRMIACFATQQTTIAPFPVELERFRTAPHYDFTVPPHSGILFYERHDWGMAGERWRDLAGMARRELGLDRIL